MTIKTVMSNDQKVKETKCTCNLFGKLPVLAASQNVDFATVLSYPLIPGPLSLCHITGAMNKTVIIRKLGVKGTNNAKLTEVDAYLIDAMFF